MADKVYPSNKTATNGGAAPNPAFPATKAQLYGATRPAYRPQPNRRRTRGSCCCACCIWVTVIIVSLLILAAIAAAAIYVIYRPHRPSYEVSGLKISSLNITSNSQLTTNINLNITTKNPNKKLVFIYKPSTISLITEKDEIILGNGLFPSFVHGAKNTTLLKATIASSGQQLDDTTAGSLRTELKSKNGLGLKLKLETKVKAKMGGLKTPGVRIRVVCDGIKATVPSGKTATTASVSNVHCKVDLRVKIWKWTF